MKTKNYLKIGILSFVMLFFANVSFSQVLTDPDSVCADESVYYKVTQGAATGTSTFNWTIKGMATGGTITHGMPAAAGNDSIQVTWGAYTGLNFSIDTVTVMESSADGCNGDMLKLGVRIFSKPVADAGSNASICQSGTYDFTTPTVPTASNYSSLLWTTNGSGAFNDNAVLATVYTPSAADITNGSVVLTLRANGKGPCSFIEDSMTLTFFAKPATVGIFHD